MRKDYKFGFRFVVLLFVFGYLLMAVGEMRDFGEPVNDNMDNYIIKNVQEETGVNNAVTAVVFDYRGFDTLGEATVLFTAVCGVLIVLRQLRDDGSGKENKKDDDAGETATIDEEAVAEEEKAKEKVEGEKTEEEKAEEKVEADAEEEVDS